MRTLAWIGSFLLYITSLSAQPLANSWIDYSSDRKYLKFDVTSTGLHRIDYNTLNFALQQIGTDISAISAQSIQLFGRGKEVTLYVAGEQDGSFDSNDEIIFFAEANDGWADASFYSDANEQTNPYYSLYTDTAAYFLTWDPAGNIQGERFSLVPFGTPASTPFEYIIEDRVRIYNDVYQKGEDLGSGKTISTYEGGKGWMSGLNGYNNGANRTIADAVFSTPQAFNGVGAPDKIIEVALAGINIGAGGNEAHHAQIQLNTGTGFNALSDVLFGSYEYIRASSAFSANLGSTTTVRVAVNPTISLINSPSDYSACAFVKLTYPRNLNMVNQNVFIGRVHESGNARFLNITNAGNVAFIYDLDTKKQYVTNQIGGNVQCSFEPGIERRVVWANPNGIINIASTNLRPINTNGRFTDPSSWERDNAYIIISHKKIWTEAERYRNYRSSRFNTVLVDIDELYDQFAFGIQEHPAAIRNFVAYTLFEWNSQPGHLFLLGKSIEESRIRKSSALKAASLVPCMGFPVSDILLTAGLAGNKRSVPAVPTGRLAARNNAEVALYLEKVRDFENAQNKQINPYTIENRQWQKHILHFAGGNDASENARFRGYLEGYQQQAEDSLFGGKVFLFSKTSGNVIEQLNTDSVRLLLEKGPAVMTFFGHASGNTFDLSVDDPNLWNNQGRYPFVIANSCFSGNIHLPIESIASISEQYLFTPREGAIAFIATPDLSYESYLNTYTIELYGQFSRKLYGGTFGQQMKATCDRMPNDDRSVGVALEMTMHGDPGLMLYPHEKSELTINDPKFKEAIRFIPANITTDLDSFSVEVKISNLGKSSSKTFNVTLTRTFPNGANPVILTKTVSGIDYEAVVVFRLAVDGENGIGENEIRIEADLPLSIITEEIEQTNNLIAAATFFLSSSDIFPIYPYDFAVVPDLDFSLKANTGFPFLPSASYNFEIDTNDFYNSPFKKSTTITQSSAVISWDPGLKDLMLADSTVFFWRVAPVAEPDKWREFSFQYIDGSVGWGQDHFFQYKNNTFDLLTYDRDNRLFDFPEASRELFVQVIGNPNPDEFFDNFYTLDGQSAPLGEYGIASVQPGFAVVVIDSVELRPWGTYGIGTNGTYVNQDKRFGNNNDGDAHRARVEYFFTFGTSTTQMASMRNMIEQHVEDGHYVLFYTQRRGNFENPSIWTEDKFDFFESLGADSIRHVPDANPYIFLVKKGQPETAKEVIGESDRSIIRLRTDILSNFRFGEMNSPKIGPAMDWGRFYFKQRALESNSQDKVVGTVNQVNSDNNSVPFDSLLSSGSLDLSSINPNSQRFAQLDFYTEDNVNITPAQLKSWHVLYEPAPDAAINPIKGQTFTVGEQITAGVDFHIGVAVENTSLFDFGKFRVRYWINDANGGLVLEEWLSYESLKANEVVFDSIKLTTNGLGGKYFGYIEVNPRDAQWHPEQYHFNNLAYFSFEIKADKKNPILDVTFDGVHILSGDIVAPQPEIVMELKDENLFLLMKDTTSFDVYMVNPSGQENRIPYNRAGREIMLFEAASSQQNKARLTYKPEQSLVDGRYTLKVIGRDASGNVSGQDAYTIDFEVINKSTVTYVMNYPNPFTTSTRFVFTLTGARIPDVFTIQILTISGKVVREITKDELGNIQIGRNITQYAWDGTDEYGDRLANGVYLYRVIMQINGEDIERKATDADQFFIKDFGKMYLFR